MIVIHFVHVRLADWTPLREATMVIEKSVPNNMDEEVYEGEGDEGSFGR